MTTAELCRSELDRYLLRMTGKTGEIELQAGESAPLFEEHFVIDIKGGVGKITANRPRALLLGVYEFLRRCGCRFLRPGEKGELIPKKRLEELTVQADVTPANRHRGITIEGAVSLKNVLDIVEWAPKVGFSVTFCSSARRMNFLTAGIRMRATTRLRPNRLRGRTARCLCARSWKRSRSAI